MEDAQPVAPLHHGHFDREPAPVLAPPVGRPLRDSPGAPGARPAVLIADDLADIRLLLASTLRPAGYELLEAADGDVAWELLLERRPRVAILDVRMSGRDGLALTRAVKAEPRLAGTRVILLTARFGESDIAAGVAAGADAYLTKPFSPLQLLATVEELTGTR